MKYVDGEIDFSGWYLSDLDEIAEFEGVLRKLSLGLAQEALMSTLSSKDTFLSLPYQWGESDEPLMLNLHLRLDSDDGSVVFEHSLKELIHNFIDMNICDGKFDDDSKGIAKAISEGLYTLAEDIKAGL